MAKASELQQDANGSRGEAPMSPEVCATEPKASRRRERLRWQRETEEPLPAPEIRL